ncbi:hypothetical protein H257_02266 [Aphanomyces astaci]|uniref:Uncharacterized protein n=1 Tax=Aphanomyces astaci TaxID=112090 RepID=W4H3C7_APHAT|nr:hypothetical protein H257_02266 [Aphanomyces astaci]ETV85648.1 hypothetical protein H257_02266 [Aphanomyces astaci]|eukprot:XP_009824120.1 hypothetical protein H257_02266 [Aphanomyces astaci]
MASATVNQTDDHQPKSPSYFCWKATYTRGVGRVPGSCAAGQERLGLLCYDKCPLGMIRVGLDCHSNCPDGLVDQGLFCRKSEYGRGFGYPWKFGDSLNANGIFQRCEKDYGKDKCEQSELVVYPKCKPGYTSFGCCICRPHPPNCTSLGLGGGLDLSCAKKITIGAPKFGTCAANEDLDAGLCYPKCKPNYTGVGPVCWGRPPPSWVHCGMGAAKTIYHCVAVVANQVLAVVVFASNIATRFKGISPKVLTGAADMSQVAELSTLWMKAHPYLAKKVLPKSAIFTVEDLARTAIALMAVLEKTGVLDVVAANLFPTCDKIEGILNGHGYIP